MHDFTDDVVPLVTVRRGEWIECFHRGVFCIVDSKGKVIAQGGAIDRPIFMRSCAKPFQAIPLIEAEVHRATGLNSAELALIVASHSGEPRHIETGRSILTKGIPEFKTSRKRGIV